MYHSVDDVDVERGSELRGVVLTREQKLQLYRDGFIVLKNVVSKQLTQSAKKLIAEEPEAASVTGSRSPFGARPEITALMNESKFTPLLKSLIGDFDAPITTHMGILPVATAPPGPLDMPYFNAGVHMDGLTTTSPVRKDGTFEEKYCEFINASPDARSHAALHQPGRHHLNIGTNGGMLFQDKDCSLSTGSFTLFAVLCLNDQTAPGHGQFCVLRGCHHAMEAFYQSQIDAGGIIGPEGPGWPRMGPMVPEAVRDHFIDEASLPAPAYDGKLFPRPTQCLMEEGDVTITMHAIPHSGTRNEGEEPRMNMIWRIRSKMRQPNFVCDGATDHPDRWSRADPRAPINGDYNMELFEQDEPPYYPGEQGNDPFERSKFALSHIWHEWPGMAETVAEMKAKEEQSGVYPKGAGPHSVEAYALWAREHVWGDGFPKHIPTTPTGAAEFWARYEQEHPEVVLSLQTETQAAKL